MATEKRLIPDGKKVTLKELLPGTIFAYGNMIFTSCKADEDCIAVKSEYRCSNGLIEAFIIDSGEQFWGGAKTAKEQNELMVQPLKIEEVVHGRWEKQEPDKHGNRKPKCSVCGEYHLAWWSDYTHCNYCPNCGAKMDGDGNG